MLLKEEEFRGLNCRLERVEAGNKETSTYSRLKGLLFCFVLSKALNLLLKTFFLLFQN